MPDDAAGQKAIDELNGAEFDHKQISVNVARPREERPSNGGNRDRRGGYNSRRYYYSYRLTKAGGVVAMPPAFFITQ